MKGLFCPMCIVAVVMLCPKLMLADTTGDKPNERKRGRWLEQLELDNAQREKLRDLWQKKRLAVGDLKQELGHKREELKQLIAGEGSPDQAREIHQKIQSIQIELGNIDLESMLAIRELLTPQQRTKFVEIMSKRGKFGEPKLRAQ